MNTQTNTYEQQATDFLRSTGTEFSAEYLRTAKYFPDDKEERDIYKITLKRGNRVYSFEFGQSINDSGFYYHYKTGNRKFQLDRKYLAKDYFKEKSLGLIGTIKIKDSSFVPHLDIIHYPKAPTAYDVLAALTKSDPGTFENFCDDFGYSTDSKNAEKTYNAIVNEYLNVYKLFTDAEIEQLQEIN